MSEQHKHAAVFEAAMQGKADEWEVNVPKWGLDWQCAIDHLSRLYSTPDNFLSRRKQKTHVVNGFTVPEPLREPPEKDSTYYVEEASYDDFYNIYQWNSDFDTRCLERGIAHATKEGAIANCKARLGIDPYKDDQCSD